MDDKFAQLYARMRGSKGFLIGLVSFVAIWLGLSITTGFDTDHGLINLFLSFEASVSLAFFAVVAEKQYEATMAMLELLKELLESIKAEEDQILAEVKEHEHGVE